MRFDDKHLVIVGGSSGIGLETARLALAEGAAVTIAGRSEERLRKAVQILGGSAKIRSVVADVTNEASIQALFECGPRVDHVFLPAGELQPGSIDVLSADANTLRATLESRLLGIAYVVRNARPKMTAGSFVLMSGLYAHRPGRGGAFAAAAVAAVEGMTRALALDLAPLRVNAVAPGLIDTPLWDAFGSQRDAILGSCAALPVGRAGTPAEIAEGVLFLMSNGFITGTVVPIDGGGSLV
jgi:NAD(P)-dependent dehydrogenase (short-subunit alcohol dehydrogenase family)